MSIPEKTSVVHAVGDVGYCKPPHATRWTKGKSGNPSGKKKGAKSFGALFCRVASKIAAVTDGDKIKKMTLLELVVATPLAQGLKGDHRNAQHAMELVEEFGFYDSPPPRRKKGTIFRTDEGIAMYVDPSLHWPPELDARLADIDEYFRKFERTIDEQSQANDNDSIQQNSNS